MEGMTLGASAVDGDLTVDVGAKGLPEPYLEGRRSSIIINPNPARSDLIQEESSLCDSKLWPLSGAARGDLGAAR